MADITKSYPYKLNIKTNPGMWEFKSFVPGVISKFVMADSIFAYFPYLELGIKDEASIFTELNLFTEFLDIEVKFSDPTEKQKINHNFYWSEYQLTDCTSQEILTGIVVYPMKSNFLKQDEVKSKSYRGDISSVVAQIMTKYKFPNFIPDMTISTTSNYDIWYQANEYDYKFIQKLAKYSLSPTFPNSPFFAFINMKGEFHFRTVADLLSQKPEVTLIYGIQDDVTQYNKDIRNDVVNEPTIQFLGSPINMESYRSEFYRLKQDGTYVKENLKLSSKLTGNRIGQNKMSIRKDDLDHLRSNRSFGIVDDFYQQSLYKGWLNNFYTNSVSFPYRMKCQLNFNAKLCSGKTVEIKFRSINAQKDNKAIEYSGTWLILECSHGIDDNGEAVTVLDLGKSSINIHKKHTFYPDFI